MHMQLPGHPLSSRCADAPGYRDEDIPALEWAKRDVHAAVADLNRDLHVDTFAPTWKVWLYAHDVEIQVLSGSGAAPLPRCSTMLYSSASFTRATRCVCTAARAAHFRPGFASNI